MRKFIFCFFLFRIFHLDSEAQSAISNFGVGYSFAVLEMPEFKDLILAINKANPGLTKSFITENQFQGFNVYWAIKNKKSYTAIQYARLNNKYKAEGVISAISPNSASYVIGSHHNLISLQYDYMLIKYLGIGAELGYHFSFFKNEQKDLFFGEVNSVVDKQGGGFYGVNVLLHIPLGRSLHFVVQPFYMQNFGKMDMDNLPVIYLGANHQVEKKTSVGGLGAHVKLGITF